MGKTKKLNASQQPGENTGKKRFASGTVSVMKAAKTRKERRKEERQAKKVRRLEFHSHRSKTSEPAAGAKGQQMDSVPKPDKSVTQKKRPKAAKKKKPQDKTMWDKIAESRREWKEEEKQLKKEMRQKRRRRLLGDAAADDDKTIRKAEKILKLNKKSKIPASFREDGLDYLLELVTSGEKDPKKSGQNEEHLDVENEPIRHDRDERNDMEDDFVSEDEDLSSDGNFDQLEDDIDEDDSNGGDMNEDLSSDQDDEDVQDSDNEHLDSRVYDDEDISDADVSSDADLETNEVTGHGGDIEADSTLCEKSRKVPKGFWEDIYGRLRDKTGAVVDEATLEPKKEVATRTGKYVPPAKRGNESGRQKILRTLKGLMNRLSEGNMHNVAKQVEDLYMSTSRNEMNELLLELLYSSLLIQTVMPDRLVLEHVMLVAILHANVGSEVGAYFIQNFVEKFRELYGKYNNMEESKELQNVVSMISAMYHFKVVGSKLMFDILEFLSNNFNIKSVELILSVLRSIGFRLRKDDPIQLKALILKIQEQASKENADNSRVRFMLEVLMAIKNNNVSKIPNYDRSHGDHLQKVIKQHFHKGNYVTELMISMEDLLKAETKGRWWLVGSAWSNVDANAQDPQNSSTSIPSPAVTLANRKLLAKAKKFGMNTDTRRSIFCVIMSAEDYLDAYEKLMHLGLRNQQAREMVHVLLYCCLHEKVYNPYYCLILEKLCSAERHFMLTLQYSLWDRLKDFVSLSQTQLDNMSSLLVNLINNRTLPITVLKVIDFADMNKARLSFLKQTLGGILLQKDQTNLEEIIVKTGSSETLHLFRESLRLFFGHFMLKESIDIEGEYPDWFKNEVVEYAKLVGQRTAAKLFIVSQKRVHEWSQKEYDETIKTQAHASREPEHSGETSEKHPQASEGASTSSILLQSRSERQLVDSEIERELFTWFLDAEPKPSSTEVREKARFMYRDKGFISMKCSYGWYRRWCNRFKSQHSKTDAYDNLLIPWILEQYDKNEIVTYANLRAHGKSVLSKLKSSFQASHGWATRFFKRHHLLLNWDGLIHALPEEMNMKVATWTHEINEQIRVQGLKQDQVGCMDEIPLMFSGSNVSQSAGSSAEGMKSMEDGSHYRKTSLRNCHAVVILGMRSDGILLPPLIVVKGQNESTLNQIYVISDENPVGVYYATSTQPDVDCLEKWTEFVWMKGVKVPSLLLCDCYEPHQELNLKLSTDTSEREINVTTFPPGCGCKLQPLNAFAKVAFQEHMQGCWESHLSAHSAESNIKLPSTNELAEWVRSAYEVLTREPAGEKLRSSFKQVGISFETS